MPLIPPPLPPGGTIGIVAPSSGLWSSQLEPALAYLHGRGYRTILGESLQHCGFRNSEDARVSDLHHMFADSAVHCIICARGGYGATRILDRLDFEQIRKHPKPLIGFSDSTALNLALLAQADLVNYSGFALFPDIKPEGIHSLTETSTFAALSGSPLVTKPLNSIRSGDASGPLIGGCLSLLTALVGTPHMPDLTGAILVIEDVQEQPYRIDRMLQQLQSAGHLDSLAALVFGRFLSCDSKHPDDGDMAAVFAEFATRLAVPSYSALPYGHGPGRLTLPIGAPCELRNGVLSQLTS
ncbi:MAG: muramoyltetrapeptide carboxypeptidase [Rhodothermales bacterium]|jgi:muramoyltetrapeptide carboxypeptidase